MAFTLPLPGRLLGRLAAVLVVLAGLALTVLGSLLATSMAPATRSVGTVRATGGVSVVDTATGVLDLDGPRVSVRAEAATAGTPVFVGIGRADDVAAYLGAVRRAEVTRVSGTGSPTVALTGSQPSLPDPAGVDIWVAHARASGAAELVWPDTPGQWRLVVATDGTAAAPSQVVLGWDRAPRSNPAPALITVGLLLLAGGAVGLLLTRGGRADPDTDRDTDSDSDPETDTGTGKDTDTDSDPETDTGRGTEAGTGTGTPPAHGRRARS